MASSARLSRVSLYSASRAFPTSGLGLTEVKFRLSSSTPSGASRSRDPTSSWTSAVPRQLIYRLSRMPELPRQSPETLVRRVRPPAHQHRELTLHQPEYH